MSEVLDRFEPGRRRVSLRDWVARAADAQAGRLFLWAPVTLVFGIWMYFALPSEPHGWVAIATALAASATLWAGRKHRSLFLLGFALAGFTLISMRASWVSTPVIRASSPEIAMSGTVLGTDKAVRGRITLLVSPESMEGLPKDQLPRVLRLSLSSLQGNPRAGDNIAFRARVFPLPSPVAPGAFDYGRRLWFEGVGGTGRVVSPVTVVGDSGSLLHRFNRNMTDLRTAMGSRIRAHLAGPVASFAEALITGERADIPGAVNDSLMASGLFHVLSISGLHMWLVAGSVFWAVRAALALSPALALNAPIKKWAAGAALLTGMFYLLLADSGVATERSFIMIAVVFFAVLVDRPALSLRNLSVAALVVLVLQPEAAIDASFQMSFLAVLGLAALYEWWSAREGRLPTDRPRTWLSRGAASLGRIVFMALATTCVASLASSIPAAYHFGRLAPYGLIANGLAFPVIGLIVMPMALASALLMPFGLEGLPLALMAMGLELVMAISDWVAAFSGARIILAEPPYLATHLMAFGAVWFCLWRGAARHAGIVLAVIGLGLTFHGKPRPSLLIESTGNNVVLRSADGYIVPASASRSKFAVERWLQANGESITPRIAAARPGWICRDGACRAQVEGLAVGYFHAEGGQPMECAGLDIVIAGFPLRGRCRNVPLRLDRFDLWRAGSHAIYITQGMPQVLTAKAQQGDRPWTLNPLARHRYWQVPAARRPGTSPATTPSAKAPS